MIKLINLRYSGLIISRIVAILMVVVSGCKGDPAPPEEKEPLPKPLASGTFWQIGTGRLPAWSDQKLADEVSIVKQAGMDIIILQYSALWDSQRSMYHSYIPNAAFETFSNLGPRDPLSAIFAAAERENVKIIIGDFLAPSNLRYEQPSEAFAHWLSTEAMNFRRTVIERYQYSPSFYGYYIANEPNPHQIKTESDKQLWIDATKQVVNFVKSIKPGLKVIHSIGLYAEWHAGSPSPPSNQYLDNFWRPWVSGIPQIDTWMMIDGIGTSLSVLHHTDVAQGWGRQLVHSFNKEFWVDVENAVMTSQFYPFTIEKLISSLNVAVKHADRIVLFEHLSYMSPNSDNVAKQLYDDYLDFRESILNR